MITPLVIAVLPFAAQIDGRVAFQDGPVPGLPGVVIGTGNGADAASVNDAMQVAAYIGVNGNATCQTGAAVLLEDHGTSTLLLCAGQTIGADTLTRPDHNVMRMSSGFLADNGLVVVSAFLNGFNVGVLRANSGGAEVLLQNGQLDDQGNTVTFATDDVLSMADNGSAGFTASHQHIYWAPLGGPALLCESDANAGAYSLGATESALWYVINNEVRRCQLIGGNTVVDTPFPGGAGLPGGPATVDAYQVWPTGGGRTAVGLIGISFADGTASWVIDTSDEPPTARLVAPPVNQEPYPTMKAISPDGVHVVVEQDLNGFGVGASYEENGSLFFTNDIPAPGGTRYIVEGYLWAAVANDGTVWFQAATATGLTEIGNEQTLYRALPGQPLQRMLGSGDVVTLAGGDLPVGLIQLGDFDSGQQYEHAASIANGPGAAVAIAAFDGTRHAVLLMGEPQIPDLAPFLNARVNGTLQTTAPIDVPFDLELGIDNTGIGIARADLQVTFTPSVAFTGVPPANCTVTQDGASTISGIDCQAAAFGDLDTNGSAFVTLANVTVLSPVTLPSDLVAHLEVFQVSGTPEGNTANSVADAVVALRNAQGNLNVTVTYAIGPLEHLIANVSVTNEGPEDAQGVQVTLPGVPAPVTLPPECSGVGLVTCEWQTIVSGATETVQIDFGPLTSDDVTSPFAPEVTSTSEDPDGPVAAVNGDPVQLLQTDVAVTATASADSDQINLYVGVANLSDITAYDVVLTEVDLRISSVGTATGLTCTASNGDVSCGPFDLPPGATATVSFGVTQYAAAALLRAVVNGNDDRDPTNNERPVGALLDDQNEPVDDGAKKPAKKGDATGCASHAVPDRLPLTALLLLAVAALRTGRRARRRR